MPLSFDPLSSPGGTRELFVDLTGALEDDETLLLAEVTSAYPAALVVSDVSVNDAAFHYEGTNVGLGKGVRFTLTSVLESRATIPLTIRFTGSAGTKDMYQVEQPLVAVITE